MDPALVARFVKVQALASRGSDGERHVAERILRKLEREHPGIRLEAARYVRRQQQRTDPQTSETRGSPAGVWPKASPRRRAPFPAGNWEDIFDFARAAAGVAYDFAETMTDAYLGTQLARHVQAVTRSTRSGNVCISLKMRMSTYSRARTLNPMQKQAFRQAMHELLEGELDVLLQEFEVRE